MNNYKQLSDRERYLIEQYINVDKIGINQIALKLNRNKSTISREIKRNSINIKYESHAAIFNAKNKELMKHNFTMSKYREFVIFFEDNFDKKYLGVSVCIAIAQKQGIKTPTSRTLYNWINNSCLDIKPNDLLRSRQIFFRKKHAIPSVFHQIPKDAIPINFRPSSINQRLDEGHYEIDLIISSQARNTGLLTLVDRKTRMGYSTKIYNKYMSHINEKLEYLIYKYHLKIKSITKDNGREFNLLFKLKEQHCFALYTCNIYASCEKGTNENFNGLIRRRFPKGTNFSNVSEEEVQLVVEQINKMPRAILGWKSSQELIETSIYEVLHL
ncbi:IS30 family transposase [Williamsoniiplasma lucivorax]|uniref:Transposase n=1 Tax=Williamsoniiplasma lucivorax TaxID=209274 RepID=A0A2S5RFJ7_9MOLU|nr:IS30 family transposase [Williamsoniiplasma lucivorax]PPE06109.1 transposase [Williamsoniiplasma lucivorax]